MNATPVSVALGRGIILSTIHQQGVYAPYTLALVIGSPIRNPTADLLAIFAFQVVVVASAGFLVWSWVLRVYPVGRMTSFSLLSPVFGVFFGWLVFSDPLSWRFVGAFAAVGVGLVLINRR